MGEGARARPFRRTVVGTPLNRRALARQPPARSPGRAGCVPSSYRAVTLRHTPATKTSSAVRRMWRCATVRVGSADEAGRGGRSGYLGPGQVPSPGSAARKREARPYPGDLRAEGERTGQHPALEKVDDLPLVHRQRAATPARPRWRARVGCRPSAHRTRPRPVRVHASSRALPILLGVEHEPPQAPPNRNIASRPRSRFLIPVSRTADPAPLRSPSMIRGGHHGMYARAPADRGAAPRVRRRRAGSAARGSPRRTPCQDWSR